MVVTLIRSLIFDLLMYGLMLVMGVVCAPAAIWSREGAYWTMKTYARTTLWLLKVICGLDYELRGTVPRGDVLVASKHQSFMDILIHFKHLNRPRFIMKKELKWAPVLGLYALRIGSTPVARGERGTAVKEMVSDVEKRATIPGQLVIYPQGTRTLPGAYLRYKVGAGVLYQRSGEACYPAATNVGVFWARRSWFRKPGVAVVEYLEPLPPGMEIDAFMRELEARVEAASDRLMREAGFDVPEVKPQQ
jgi:1-acyl-sn-glycerol-3-phosphate acyltransferase